MSTWNFKGQFKSLMTAEPGIGRGQFPLFPLAETFSKGASGGPDLASAISNSFITNRNYGMMVKTHAVGHADFTELDNTKLLFWFENNIEFIFFVGRTPKELVSKLSLLVGRMKELPEWTSNGLIAGIVGG